MSKQADDYFKKSAEFLLLGLKELGLDITDENFIDTPDRIVRSYNEIFYGVKDTDEKVNQILSTAFPSNFSEIIIAKDIRVFSMCPHHFLPVEYKIHVAYIPEEDGKVLGISKLSRITELLAKRPVLQEQFVDDVTSALMKIGSRAAACIATGTHFCMKMRGVKQNSDTITSSLKGVFLTNQSARTELMLLLK